MASFRSFQHVRIGFSELSTCSDRVQRLKLGTVSRVNLARITTWTYCASFQSFPVGFLTLPLLVLAGIVLLVSSMVQAGGYLCTTARLSDLSMPHGDLHFHSWIREYEVRARGEGTSRAICRCQQAMFRRQI